MQRSWMVVLACVLSGGLVPLAGAQDRPPNVIVILTDDQGTVDAGCYGSDLLTPGIDALAASGLRFTQFYAAAPVCSPSRAGLLTGRYPVRAEVPGNVSSQPGNPGLPGEQVTLAEVFAKAGYETAHIGKWHLGFTEATLPNGQGFDHSFGHMGGCIDNWSHFFYWNGPNRHDLWRNGEEVQAAGQFFPDLMLQEARRFIGSHRDEPFFLYFALNAPHYPYQGTARWLEHYADLPYPRNLYAAFVSTLDERIAGLVSVLEQEGLREDTILVFQSDHGHSTEVRAHGGGGSAGPYRGAKFSLFEGGIRVPAIVSWPGRLPSGEVRDQVGHACDWLPTLAKLCGIDLGDLDIDGTSLVPVLKSAEAGSPHEVLVWHGSGSDAQWAVRAGAWKLIGNPRDPTQSGELDRLFLANLREDPGEQENRAQEHPEIVQELQRHHDEWLERVQ